MIRSYTQNRELSWLRFNERVLQEAADETVPLLERLKFISIFTSNLDEFFMIRVGSLYDLAAMKKDAADGKTGMTAQQQLDAIYDETRRLTRLKDETYLKLESLLREKGICDLAIEELGKEDAKFVKQYFKAEIEPILSPQIVDGHHPFPHLANKMMHIGAALQDKNGSVFGVIPLPASLPDILLLPGEGARYVRVSQIVLSQTEKLFAPYQVLEKAALCVTRNADITPNDEAFEVDEDFRQTMRKLLKERRRLAAVRLELGNEISRKFRQYFCQKLHIEEKQCYVTSSPIKMGYAFSLADKLSESRRAPLLYEPFAPQPSSMLIPGESVIKQVLKRDILLSYPFESMEPFLQMVREAAFDPAVQSIKISIYRMASRAKLVEYLCAAAENGKDVTTLIELRARFDEQNNIDWSKQLEEAGCTVFYGFDDYKVHSKLTLITSKVNGKYHYLTQIGTGNYNEKTSELYTDLSFITTRQEIGEEASAVFNNMALQRLTSEADTMLVAPLRFKSVLLEQMDRQIDRARRGLPASMILKNNSINDPQIINKISEASCAGVRVDMIVRGICCIKAGVPGKTENVHIRSIVGRYLEHSRIYCFGEGEDMTIYIASGDFLTRNTERRVEVGVRVDDREIAKKLRGILDLQLRDTVNAREMQPDGIYTRVKPKQGEPPVDSQMAMYGYFQHGFETAHPAAPTRKAAAKPVQKPKRPTPHPHKPENKRFRGFLDSLFGHKK